MTEAQKRIDASDEVAYVQSFHLPANQPPWIDSGWELKAGDYVTWLATGRCNLSEEADLWMGPRYALWARLGDEGPIFNGTRSSTTFCADRDARLFFATYQGEWADRRGRLATPVEGYASLTGGFDVTLIRWKGDPRSGLASIADVAGAAQELERLRAPVLPPEGWRYLWFLGESEIFRPGRHDGRATIEVAADNDVGILQKPVDFPLSDETRLEWSWCVDQLPTDRAEDTMPTHDYVSLALEFDNGLDLTWYWSAALEPETHYTCPLPTWAARETHVVVRQGSEGIGEWHRESRGVRSDYAVAVGEPPQRIVSAWIIAVSLFRHGSARARFAQIQLHDGTRSLDVF